MNDRIHTSVADAAVPATAAAAAAAAAAGAGAGAGAGADEPGLNELWLGCLLDLLCAHGVERALLSPGARSSAMVLAARSHPGIVHTQVCNDERSAAYMALGAAKASGRPVLVVTTSGSAVANVVPALTEADACGARLVILSCDRPRALRGTGFGQMTDHVGACAAFVRASVDLEDPDDTVAAFRAMHAAVDAALALGQGPRPGPVHLNVPVAGRFDAMERMQAPSAAARAMAAELRERPCAAHAPRGAANTVAGAAAGAATSTSMVMATATAAGADTASRIATLAGTLPLRPGLRGLIVAGPECALAADALADFCARVGYPVLADAASGLRAPGRPDVLSGFDALVARWAFCETPPELVIRFGHAPLMPCVQDYLLAHPAPTLKVSPLAAAADYLHPRFGALVAPTAAELDELAARLGPGDPAWRAAWQLQASGVRTVRKVVLDQLAWGELTAARALFAYPGFDLLHVGNSMPIRHADMLDDGLVARAQVLSNRGVCGIDGTVGSFLGAAQAAGCAAGLLVLGDLALLHDLPALAAAQAHAGCACICVIHNGGGAIFDFLPLAQRADYAVAIRNSHAVDFCAIAAGFGLPHARATDHASLDAALAAARRHPGVSLVEVRVDPASARRQSETLQGLLALLDAPPLAAPQRRVG